MRSFTCRTARSLPLVVALIAITVVEGVAFTFLLASRSPIAAWVLLAVNAVSIAWFLADYRAMGSSAVDVGDDSLKIRIGLRWQVEVPRRDVAKVMPPSFRDLPAPGTVSGQDYANLTKPASPNVLIVLEQPARAKGPAGIRKSVRRVGLHLDEPAEFIALFQRVGSSP